MSIVNCQNCQSLAPPGAEKCPHCGAVLEKKTKPHQHKPAPPAPRRVDKVQCKSCGATMSARLSRCPKCGSEETKQPREVGNLIQFGILVALILIGLNVWWDYTSTDNNGATRVAAAPKVSDAECKKDIQCWGDRQHLSATFECQKAVENKALYDIEWTDGMLGAKFDSFFWADPSAGILVYRGNSAKFQNGFGAWSQRTYDCQFDPSTGVVQRVTIFGS